MHVLFVVPRVDKASTRYRVLQYLPYLEKQGISFSIKELSKKARDWVALFQRVKQADVVFIQKKIFSKWEIFLIRRIAKRIIFDFDDSIMVKDGAVTAASLRRQSKRFGRMVCNADLVICGNAYLKTSCEPWNAKLRLLPTPIDTVRYVEKNDSLYDSDTITLGWIGSRVTLKYLKDIAPALSEVARRCPGTRLKIVADEFFDVEGMEVIKQPWSDSEEIADLHSFDVGLMPLTDDVWTRGKCGFKLLQCMAVGTPVVCSPVGMNREIVTDGVEGFWATSQEEWSEKLVTLIQDRQLRFAMGKKGIEKVEKTYSLAVNAELLIAYLKEVCAF